MPVEAVDFKFEVSHRDDLPSVVIIKPEGEWPENPMMASTIDPNDLDTLPRINNFVRPPRPGGSVVQGITYSHNGEGFVVDDFWVDRSLMADGHGPSPREVFELSSLIHPEVARVALFDEVGIVEVDLLPTQFDRWAKIFSTWLDYKQALHEATH